MVDTKRDFCLHANVVVIILVNYKTKFHVREIRKKENPCEKNTKPDSRVHCIFEGRIARLFAVNKKCAIFVWTNNK